MDQLPAAGAINSTAADMVRWIRFQLDSARVGGKRLVSIKNFRETHTPQTVIRIDSAYRAMNPYTHLQSYAFGWTVSDYRGREMLRHAGNLSGMAAMVGLLPEERAGIVVLTNLEGNALRESLMYKAFDLILGASPKDWSAENLAEARGIEAAAKERERRRDASRVRGTRPTLPLEQYAGNYEDPLYGLAQIAISQGHLVLNESPTSVGDLEHWNYDTFRVVWRDHRDGKSFVTFGLDPMGKVSEMRFEPDGQFAEETPVFKRIRTAAK
jgi:CubicO group peptidase (beta-lactamase class C family)